MSHLYFDAGEPATGQKVMLATPTYGNPDPAYTFAMSLSREALHKAGIQTAYMLLVGNCHVDDARNTLVKSFMETDCTDLVFLDADVDWDAEQLVRLCRHDCDVVGGVYPRRDPGQRDDLPCRTMPGATMDAKGLIEMAGLPTGFLRIRRNVFECLVPQAPAYRVGRSTQMLPILFERLPVDGVGRLSGDLAFCHKWRMAGGRIFADANLRLGHVGRITVHDDLGAALRRQTGETYKWICDRIRTGTEDLKDYQEALVAYDNRYAIPAVGLAASVAMARLAKGPIIEAGTGLTTVFMAAANPDHYVYCLEHDPAYAASLKKLARLAGVRNIALCECPIRDGWYDLSHAPDIPRTAALGIVDGPPRALGSRIKFFDHFQCEALLVDDVTTHFYMRDLLDWSQANDYGIAFQDRIAILRRNKKDALAA